MNQHADDPRAALRWTAYSLLIALSVGGMLGRLLAVNSVDRVGLEALLYRQGRDDWQKQRPFLSANDRSRWLTVRALVEHGTYAIDDVRVEPNWDTIDMVYHDGHFYSSKPPLLPTLVAGPYWLIHRTTGATLGTHPYEIGRGLLVLINVLPLAAMFWLLARLVERYAASDWSRLFVMAAATGGTFLTTFAVTFNNHLVAAVCGLAATYCAIRIVYEGERTPRWFVAAGLLAALTAANELPALALAAILTLGLLWQAPRATLIWYLPAALLVAAAFFGTNWLAHGDLRPAYAHRHGENNWYDYTYEHEGRLRDSYWRDPQGIDRGEACVATYALHVLIGHHGIFSLTPIWLLAVLGLVCAAVVRSTPLRALLLAVGLTSIVCVVFYVLRPQPDRNYGGMTSGFRWAFWLAPLWLLLLLPAVDWIGRRRAGRWFAVLLLIGSAISANYPTWNPWSHPWLYNALEYLGWLGGS